MAAGTVAYQDTRGNKDYLGIIANQIGRRLKEASDMASDERAFAEKKAEEGGTSLDEAGIGKGYFFKRALGSRFGGDRIARTRGRMGATGAGTSPTGNFKTRFRGGFDYNVTNEIQSATVPLSSALVGGLRGVESSLTDISGALTTMGSGMSDLARGQADMAKATFMNGQVLRVMVTEIKRQQARLAGRREERAIEGAGFRRGGGGGGGLPGGGDGRRMINVTPQPRKFNQGNLADLAGTTSSITRQLGGSAAKAGQKSARTGLRALTTSVARPIVGTAEKVISGGRTIAKFTPNIPKLGQAASKYLGTGVAATTKFFKQAAQFGAGGLNPFGRAFLDARKLMDADGMFNYARKGSKSFEMLKDLGAAGMNKNLAAIYAGGGSLDDFVKALVGGGMPIDMVDDALTDYTQLSLKGLGQPSRNIAKQMSPKAAASLTPSRISSLSEAGYKTAEIATDQLVKKGMQQGLKRGSGLARTMVKTFGAAGTRSFLKKIPILAGVAGTIFAIQRAMEGDFLGAGLELTSGLLGATGIGGIGPGLAIDGYLLARDFGVVPMAKGGLLTGKQPVNALMGEAGPEIVTPLNDDTFIKFGEGVLNAQKQNKTDYAKVQAEGLKQYYEGMGGWNSFGSAFTGIFDTLKDIISNIRIPNPFNFGRNNNNNGGNRPGVTAGSDTLDIGAGGGELTGLSKEDYIQIAKTIAGEAGPGDDQYLVAAAILNRVASSKFPNNVTDVVQAGQYDGGPVQFEGYKANANVDDIVKRLLSPEGQARLVEALNRMEGRTDFKGQALLKNRVAAEDPMFDKKGNYGHYWWQKGPNSTMPSDYVMPNYQQFIKSTNAADQQASILNTNSALTGANGLSLMTPTVINNYYTNNSSGAGDGGSEFFGPAFGSTDLNAFTLRYSLAAK